MRGQADACLPGSNTQLQPAIEARVICGDAEAGDGGRGEGGRDDGGALGDGGALLAPMGAAAISGTSDGGGGGDGGHGSGGEKMVRYWRCRRPVQETGRRRGRGLPRRTHRLVGRGKCGREQVANRQTGLNWLD